MNIKLDENLPERLVSKLQALGHNVDTVRSEHLAGRDDDEVWQAAQAAARFLITQDLDFSDVHRFTPGTHARLLLVRLAQPGRNALAPEWPFCSRPSASMNGKVAWSSRPSTRCGSSALLERRDLGAAAQSQL